ncbi:MAG TPA: hypothetical protein PK566_11545 [Pseudobacteroides sp.]|nr:hypothetical protein [Pseudobacteroides sp.]
MSYIKERVAYLKGLAEGLNISESSSEGKLLKAILEVMDDIAVSIEDLEESVDEISEQVDEMDEDLSYLSKELFDDEDCCDEDVHEVECPYCNEVFELDTCDLDEDSDEIECPNCKKKIEINWDCECDCDECNEDEKN